MPKRRRSWGSIKSLGRNRQIVRWVENTPEGRVRKSKTLECTYREADRWLAEKRIEREEPAVMTVGGVWDAYERPDLEDRLKSGDISPNTLRQYDSTWRRHVSPRWARVPCTEVRALDVQEWLLSLPVSAAPLSLILLRKVLDRALMLEIVQANVASRRYRMPKKDGGKEAPYTLEELAALADAVRDTACEVPFILSAFGGLRVGEACGAPLSCVEFRDGAAVVRVRFQLDRHGVTDRLKNRTSRRTAAVAEPWASRLREIADSLPGRAVYLNDDGTGEPHTRNEVAWAWRKAVEASGIDYRPMQVLRPSYETWMHWSGEVPVEKLAKMMGHATSVTTEREYDRPDDADVAAIAAAAAARAEYPK